MKISINLPYIDKPFGGGHRFVVALREFLINKSHEVVNHLQDSDIDLILLVSPLYFQVNSYNYLKAAAYKLKHPRTIIVHRVNTTDIGRGSHEVDFGFQEVSKWADYTIFISEWVHKYYKENGLEYKKYSVIHNGADTRLFNSSGGTTWNGKGPLRIVSHLWSTNFRKGKDVYEKLDRLLADSFYQERFQFTYIGQKSQKIKLKNSRWLEPLYGDDLVDEIKRHHTYLAPFTFEAAGMSHIEGASCGLPLLYRNSGALPEYCDGFGVIFDENNFVQKLEKIYQEYSYWKSQMSKYSETSDKMLASYYEVIIQLLSTRSEQFQKTDSLTLKLLSLKIKSFNYKIYFLYKKIRKKILKFLISSKRLLIKK